MTIDEYYITFGFKVKLTSLMKKAGYSIDQLTPEIRQEHYQVYSKLTDEETLVQYFKQEYLNGGHAGQHEFEINGTKFIIRSFTHDKKDYNNYVVIGVNLGTIQNFEGILATTGQSGQNGLKVLIGDDDWTQIITEAEDVNGACFVEIDYGVKDPKYNKCWIAPKVFITTNDCGCCS